MYFKKQHRGGCLIVLSLESCVIFNYNNYYFFKKKKKKDWLEYLLT